MARAALLNQPADPKYLDNNINFEDLHEEDDLDEYWEEEQEEEVVVDQRIGRPQISLKATKPKYNSVTTRALTALESSRNLKSNL